MRDRPTLPFDRSQMVDILAACDRHGSRPNDGRKIKAFVLLARYSGMREGDIATLAKDRIDANGRLFLYTAKTGEPVWMPLPEVVTNALARFEHVGRNHFFWTGAGSTETVAGNWRRALRRMFLRAGIPDGHAHRFRDTFAVECLLSGIPMDRVSVLLGHSSIRVTERHYAPWVRERQEQIEADLKRAWASDPTCKNDTDKSRTREGEVVQ